MRVLCGRPCPSHSASRKRTKAETESKADDNPEALRVRKAVDRSTVLRADCHRRPDFLSRRADPRRKRTSGIRSPRGNKIERTTLKDDMANDGGLSLHLPT
ncbi:hypothetical protein SPI_05799 [Niveomyces insectorum RCEF 264]|uniref:Uncharacterized protein n=1 Tax=Niveomyces insectorum RCEF 264 TaxID=1081102 RepID=A0A167SGA2_9HYPO|nr:hypothetical protein SPI_05799 [Niveomyces insectorum RCEF 264]